MYLEKVVRMWHQHSLFAFEKECEFHPNTRLGAGPSTGPTFINFCRAQPCHMYSDEARFRVLMSLIGNFSKENQPSTFNGRDVPCSMDELNLTHNESSSQGEPHPENFMPAQRIGAKVLPLGCHIRWLMFGPNPSITSLDWIWQNQVIGWISWGSGQPSIPSRV